MCEIKAHLSRTREIDGSCMWKVEVEGEYLVKNKDCLEVIILSGLSNNRIGAALILKECFGYNFNP